MQKLRNRNEQKKKHLPRLRKKIVVLKRRKRKRSLLSCLMKRRT
jgi:hypothetical protein